MRLDRLTFTLIRISDSFCEQFKHFHASRRIRFALCNHMDGHFITVLILTEKYLDLTGIFWELVMKRVENSVASYKYTHMLLVAANNKCSEVQPK